MKRIFTLFVLTLLTTGAFAQLPTIYASVASGNYDAAATWETFTGNATNTPGAQGTGTAASGGPSGTHFVYIRAGHTISMNLGGRSCLGMKIEATGKLWANEATARRLQIASGGTGFAAPQNWTIENNGTMGGPNDGLFFEPGANCGTVTLAGTGVYQIQRIRIPGSLTSQNVTVIFDQNAQLTQPGNYILTNVYNPTATNVFTVTINSGKTVSSTAADGYFHNNASTSSGGTYVYNINGTLDLSSNTQPTTNITALGPLANAPSNITVNVAGTLKLGTSFTTTANAGNPGGLNLNLSGLVDATNTTNLNIDNNFYFKVSGTGAFQRTVAASDVLFPVGVGSSYNPAWINNAGTSDAFTVSVKNTVDNAVNDNTKIVNKQWTITEGTPTGSNATIKLGWITADQASGFNPAASVVIARWTGTAWVATPATVTGTGTIADPYIATATGFTAFSPFIVANAAALPVSFAGNNAYAKDKGVQVEWSVATESNIKYYSIERSLNGKDFSSVGIVESKGNSSVLTNYSFFDATPVAGTNYYRVKALDKDGSYKLTGIMQVNISKGKAEIIVAPNPVRNSDLNIQLSGLTKGSYSVRVLNNAGQVVFMTQLSADNASVNRSFKLPSTVKAGIYTLQVAGNDVNLNRKIVIE